jgi:adenine C2-methylase RlmN of 23S rRNA A2503 and tRNA A37
MPTKYKHADGTESILKIKHYEYDKNTFERKEVKRDFVTLFVSVSRGCNIGCKLCFLTYNNINYQLISPNSIINNNICLCRCLKYDNVKISFMGMGEGILHYKHLKHIAAEIAGEKLYSIDIGTMLPFATLDLQVALNVLYNGRIFYSLHSANQSTRDKLIESKVSVEEARKFLCDLEIRKVCHYTLIDGLNDTEDEIDRAIDFCSSTNSQLRLIDFNEPKSITGFKPSNRKIEIAEHLKTSEIDYKLCYSSGKSMKAACGMFQ